MTRKRLELGRYGEDLAVEFLIDKGYEIIDRNVRYPTGELDIVARETDTLVFVEVRTRSGFSYGNPGESITWRKQQKLRQLALLYLQSQDNRCKSFRIDAILIVIPKEYPQKASIEHVLHAA